MTDASSKSIMSEAARVITQVVTSIVIGDTEGILFNLNLLPIATLPRNQAEALISCFLDQCMKCKNISAIREIINVFNNERIRTDPLPALTNLFLNTSLSRETLQFVISCYPEKEPVDYYMNLVNMGDDASALKIAALLTVFFPNIEYDTWSFLVSMTENFEDEEYENQMLREFFLTKAAETGSDASVPEWVCNDLKVYKIEKIPNGIPSVAEAVDLLLADIKDQNIEIKTDNNKNAKTEEIRELLISQYAISTITEKIQMLEHLMNLPKFDDNPLFHEFGPVNTIYSPNSSLHDSNHECTKYGGCRMFLCKEFEQMHANGDEIDIMAENIYISDWFRKSCDLCLKKIKSRFHALRLPLKHGGFRGCYCSLDCMKPFIDNPITAIMVGRMIEQLNTIKIRERN